MNEHHDYLKVPEVAEILQVARSRAYVLVADDEIPAINVDGVRKVSSKKQDL